MYADRIQGQCCTARISNRNRSNVWEGWNTENRLELLNRQRSVDGVIEMRLIRYRKRKDIHRELFCETACQIARIVYGHLSHVGKHASDTELDSLSTEFSHIYVAELEQRVLFIVNRVMKQKRTGR